MEEPAVVFNKRIQAKQRPPEARKASTLQVQGLQKHAKQAPYQKTNKTKTDPEGIQRRFNAGGGQNSNSGGRETGRESEERVPTRGPKNNFESGWKTKKEVHGNEDFGESNSSVEGWSTPQVVSWLIRGKLTDGNNGTRTHKDKRTKPSSFSPLKTT